MSLQYREGSNYALQSTNDMSTGGTYQTTNSLTSSVGLIVKQDSTAGFFVPSAAATDKHMGVLLDEPGANQVGTIRLRNCTGTSIVQLGGTVAVNDNITANSVGQGIATTTSGDEVIGIAMEAGTTGAIIEIMPVTRKY